MNHFTKMELIIVEELNFLPRMKYDDLSAMMECQVSYLDEIVTES